jgi:hypothetical protein
MEMKKQEKAQRELENTYKPEELDDAKKKIEKFMGKFSSTIYREYLPLISRNYDVEELSENPQEAGKRVAYIELKKFVIDEENPVVDCLKTVYHVLAYTSNSIALIIRRMKKECTIGIAVGNSEASSEKTSKIMAQLRDALIGNFPGTEIKGFVAGDENQSGIKHNTEGSLLSTVLNETYAQSVAVVSNVATELTEDFSVQGIEKLIDGIRPRNEAAEYTLILLGESMSNDELVQKKEELFRIYSALSPFAERQENWSLGKAKEWSNNWNTTVGAHAGLHINKKIPILMKVNGGLDAGVDVHGGYGHTWGTSISANSGGAVDIVDYKVKHTLEMIERQMQRLEESEALGLWNFAAYIISTDLATTQEAAHMYMSLTQGKESFYEKSAINIWDVFKTDEREREEQDKQIKKMLGYLKLLRHPVFRIKQKVLDGGYYPKETVATTTLSGAEFARALNLPGKSIPGFDVIKCASFGREISSYDTIPDANVHLGAIHHMHQDEDMEVSLSGASLTSHVFVTGSTGTGKSNTVYTILNELMSKGDETVSFLVVEPTKGEYGYAFGKNVTVYGTRPNTGKMLRLNPFAFPDEIHVFEHIDRILEVFNVCWPMYAAMPAVLKDAVIGAYEKCGWDLKHSTNRNGSVYPTFEDVLGQIDEVMDRSMYSDENKGNYKGALSTRVQSLTNGLNGMIFCEENISETSLFDENVIVDMSKIGASETKSLIMGVLVIKLQEYRMTQGGMNASLKHVTVLEEAHNILKNTQVQGSGESSNIAAKSVEMISNAIAEMRTYGEGFVIVDQSPGLMDMSVIRNTNTKIILRLPDQSDRELVGKSAGLNEKQIEELARLQRGVAAVYQNEWVEPVLCRVKKFIGSTDEKPDCTAAYSEEEQEKCIKLIATCVYNPDYLPRESDLDFVDAVERVSLSGQLKALLLDYYRTPYPRKQDIWQKTVHMFFKKEIKRITEKVEESDWLDVPKLRDLVMNEIRNSYGLYEPQTSHKNVAYRFMQAFLYESIHELSIHPGEREVEICKKLEGHMNELREEHRNEIR